MKKIILAAATILGFTTFVSAQWNPDSTQNNPVVTGSNTTSKNNLVSASDGNGGMYIAWEDSRTTATTGSDIYLQKLNADGTVAFTQSGLLITNSLNSQTNISIVADGSGGVVLVWQDARDNNRTDIYGQRITSAGTNVWTAGGIVVADTSGQQTVPIIERVNATEVMVFYRTNLDLSASPTGTDLYVSKLNLATGARVFDNKRIANGTGTQTAQVILADGAGGAFLTWQDPRLSTSNSDIFSQRVNNIGDTLWGSASNPYNGVAVSMAANNQLVPQIASDSAGGIIITWGDLRTSTTDANIYAQRLNGSGVPQWTVDGRIVNSAPGNQANPIILASNTGTYFIAWSDQRQGTSNRDLYLQKINVAGDTLFVGVSGKPIATAIGNQPVSTNSAVMVRDGANGAILVWDDARVGNSGANGLDIRAQRVNANGDPLWLADGVPVATRQLSNQANPVAIADNAGGAIVAWQDSRTSASGEIYASKVYSNGALPVTFINITAAITSNAIAVNWKASCDNMTDRFEIEKSVDGRQFKSIGLLKAPVVTAACLIDQSYADHNPVAGNNYYRIKGVDKDGKFAYSPIARIKFGGNNATAIQLYPNPAKDVVNVQMMNLAPGKYTLRLLDANGKLVQNTAITVQLNYQQQMLQVSKLNAGNYILNVINENGKVVSSKQLLKQ